MGTARKDNSVEQKKFASHFCCTCHLNHTGTQLINDARKDQVPYYLHKYRIESGYRKGYKWKNVILSIFAFHNETGNIWTHLIPVIGFTAMWVWFWVTWDGDFWYGVQLHILIVVSLMCVVLSTFYHLTSCISESVNSIGYCVDTLGIAMTLIGAYFSQCTVLFYECHFYHWLLYVGLTFSCGALGMIFRPCVSWIHQLMFSLPIIFSIVPLSHFLEIISKLEPSEWEFWFYDVFLLQISGIVCFILGFCVWKSCFPEVLFKSGSFDFIGHSHQIWHLFVNVALILMGKASYSAINHLSEFETSPFCLA